MFQAYNPKSAMFKPSELEASTENMGLSGYTEKTRLRILGEPRDPMKFKLTL